MRSYELMLIVAPDVESPKIEELSVKITKIIEDGGGKVEKKDIWGKKNLTYKIAKFKEGFYIFYSLNFLSTQPLILENKLSLENQIIRHLLIVK